MTLTLQRFLEIFSGAWGNLQPAITFLIKVFLGIEIVMFGFWMAMGGIDNLASAMKKLLYLLVWAWIIKEFPMLSNAFVESLVMAGQKAGGGSGGNIFDPSNVIRVGMNNLFPALTEVSQRNIGTEFFNMLMLYLCLFLVAIAYLIIAWQIFYCVLEFYLISALVGLFLPFGFFEPTKFLAEKSIGAIVSAGIKLMVLAFLVSIIQPTLQDLTFSDHLSLSEALSALLMAGALAFLCWNAPGVAAGLMSGSPSLSAGVAMQNAMVAGGAAAMAIWGASKAAGGAFNAVKSAVSAVSGGTSGSSGGGVGSKVGSGAGKAAGTAIQQSSKVAGQGVQKAGEGVSAAGHGVRSAGGAIAATPVPVVSQVAGAVVGAAGTATDLAGKGVSAAGKGIEKAGEVSGKAVEKAGETAGKVADKTAETAAKTAQSAGTTPQSGSDIQPKKDNSSDWAKAALKAMQHTPQEAHPSGGGSQPKL
jgi:type IV secretion system protein TrbL